jgi:hypothetical protein
LLFPVLTATGTIVLQGEALPDGERLPVPLGTRAKYPSWCNHYLSAAERAKRRAKPKLRLVEKQPDDTA